MKRILVLALALIMMMTMSAMAETYTSTQNGYGGAVTVNTTIEDGKIVSVELGEHKESLVVIERAFPMIAERIVEANTADVDSITAATFSSYAVKAAVADAMAQAGMEAPAVGMFDKKEYPAVTLEDVTADIVIVGGGPSGLAAAITAKEVNPDLHVLVVEKMDILSGNGKFDLNFYDVFNSEAQKANGVVDSREKFIADMSKAGNTEERLKVWAEGEEVIDAWLRSFGVTLDHNYNGRNHIAPKDDYAGQMIQREMERHAYELGVEIRTGVKGYDLVMDGQTAKGVMVTTNKNESYNILAKKTILATGGFSNNQELLAKYAPNHVGYPTSNQIGATGDFVPVFEKLGFGLDQMGKIRVIDLILQPSRDLTNSAKGTVLVNKEGKRFMNERVSELNKCQPIREQGTVYMVVDTQKVKDAANVRKQVKEGRFAVCQTMDDVAAHIGCDAETLKATFAAYNEHAANGTEDEFGHKPERAILEEGPYYVSVVTSAIHMTKGGVTCDEKAQVLYADGAVVNDLYACGEVTWQSGGYSQSVVFGRIAGENAAKALSGIATYRTKANGYGGEMEVAVTFDHETLTDVTVLYHHETTAVSNRAFPILEERLIEAQTAQIDSVSAATFSSYAVKSAVAKAAAEHGLDYGEVTFTTAGPENTETPADVNTGIVIVGGGPSGLAAAIAAKENGAEDVLVIEKLDILSGNGKFDMNFYDLVNSKAMQEAGIEDSADKFYEDMIGAGNGEARTRVWADVEATTDAWLRSFGVTLDYTYGMRNHMQHAEAYAGEHIQDGMEAHVANLGVNVMTGVKGVDLIMDGKKCVGVLAEQDGKQFSIYADKIILATGGFSANKELLAKYAPGHEVLQTSNQMGATGDFVPVFEKRGFKLENMGNIRVFPYILAVRRDLTGGSAGFLLFNKNGERFIDETAGNLGLGTTLLEQSPAYYIYDSTNYNANYRLRKHTAAGYHVKADTLDELSEKLGMNAENLKAGIETYNKAVAGECDDPFRAKPGPRAFDAEGPYYAAHVESAVHMTKGGVSCNEFAQVLYADDTVVENLYACGEVTWQSGGYSQSVVFGRVAGEQAAKAMAE